MTITKAVKIVNSWPIAIEHNISGASAVYNPQTDWFWGATTFNDSFYFGKLKAGKFNSISSDGAFSGSAARLTTAREIKVVGSGVVGAAMFDGSENVVINLGCSGCAGSCSGNCTGKCSGCTGCSSDN